MGLLRSGRNNDASAARVSGLSRISALEAVAGWFGCGGGVVIFHGFWNRVGNLSRSRSAASKKSWALYWSVQMRIDFSMPGSVAQNFPCTQDKHEPTPSGPIITSEREASLVMVPMRTNRSPGLGVGFMSQFPFSFRTGR